jgi:hypothetical protein
VLTVHVDDEEPLSDMPRREPIRVLDDGRFMQLANNVVRAWWDTAGLAAATLRSAERVHASTPDDTSTRPLPGGSTHCVGTP